MIENFPVVNLKDFIPY